MTMQASSSFKLAFLKQMLRGFHQTAVLCSSKNSSSSLMMSLEDRKDAIKLAADVAMAAARGGAARWARGLMANLAMNEQRRPLLRSILTGNDRQYEQILMIAMIRSKKSSVLRRRSIEMRSTTARSKSIIRRSFRVRSARRKMRSTSTSSSILARSIVRKRTHVLKKLIPGGEAMDGSTLLDETLDYVISLRAQVDLMRRLLKASSDNKTSSSPASGSCKHFSLSRDS